MAHQGSEMCAIGTESHANKHRYARPHSLIEMVRVSLEPREEKKIKKINK
jgi:hypothetical protein